jgi:hypothetical protein
MQLENTTPREYLIFPYANLNYVDFTQVLETSAETVRRSVDGLKTFVKWEGQTPGCIGLLYMQGGTEGPYNHEEMLDILATPEWTDPNPPYPDITPSSTPEISPSATPSSTPEISPSVTPDITPNITPSI